MDLRVISIGTLSAHPLWGEKTAVRSGHCTSTLIRTADATILVDPGLPESIITARLGERTGLTASDITHVFLTSFKPETRRGLGAFADATWWISREEREGAGVPLVALLRRAAEAGDANLRETLEKDVALLQRFEEAPDTLAEGVDLFPLPGVTPGMCGVLIEEPELTTLVCGDAVPTSEHVARRMVLPNCADVTAARASFAEACEIADVLILGRDNMMLSPGGKDEGAGGEA